VRARARWCCRTRARARRPSPAPGTCSQRPPASRARLPAAPCSPQAEVSGGPGVQHPRHAGAAVVHQRATATASPPPPWTTTTRWATNGRVCTCLAAPC